jgi:hypothetical protein
MQLRALNCDSTNSRAMPLVSQMQSRHHHWLRFSHTVCEQSALTCAVGIARLSRGEILNTKSAETH